MSAPITAEVVTLPFGPQGVVITVPAKGFRPEQRWTVIPAIGAVRIESAEGFDEPHLLRLPDPVLPVDQR